MKLTMTKCSAPVGGAIFSERSNRRELSKHETVLLAPPKNKRERGGTGDKQGAELGMQRISSSLLGWRNVL